MWMCGLSTLAFVITGCSDHSNSEGPEQLVLVTSADYPPFEFVKNGEVVGFDIDVAKAITRLLGVGLSVQDVNFSGLIPALNSGRADFAMSGLTVTPERLKNVDFSVVYFQPSLSIVAKADAPIQHVASLANKKIGAQLGSIMEEFAKEQSLQLPGITVVALGRNSDLIQELKLGRLDAVILESAQAAAFASIQPELVFTILPEKIPGYAIAFPKGSPWIEKFNTAIRILSGNGQLSAIENEWLSRSDHEFIKIDHL